MPFWQKNFYCALYLLMGAAQLSGALGSDSMPLVAGGAWWGSTSAGTAVIKATGLWHTDTVCSHTRQLLIQLQTWFEDGCSRPQLSTPTLSTQTRMDTLRPRQAHRDQDKHTYTHRGAHLTNTHRHRLAQQGKQHIQRATTNPRDSPRDDEICSLRQDNTLLDKAAPGKSAVCPCHQTVLCKNTLATDETSSPVQFKGALGQQEPGWHHPGMHAFMTAQTMLWQHLNAASTLFDGASTTGQGKALAVPPAALPGKSTTRCAGFSHSHSATGKTHPCPFLARAALQHSHKAWTHYTKASAYLLSCCVQVVCLKWPVPPASSSSAVHATAIP